MTTVENIVNVNGSTVEAAGYDWLEAKQQFGLTYLLSLHIKTLWLLLISNHEWLLIGNFRSELSWLFSAVLWHHILLASTRKELCFNIQHNFSALLELTGTIEF